MQHCRWRCVHRRKVSDSVRTSHPWQRRCSFYPANLWSTSLVGDFGIVVTNTSDRLTASVTLSDASGVIETKSIPPAMGQSGGGVAIFRLSRQNKLAETEIAKKASI